MQLERYTDAFVANEVGNARGRYVISYATAHRLVEVHLFDRGGDLVVYVTKAAGVSAAAAQLAATDAIANYTESDPVEGSVTYELR